jgi:hypothetical protein
MAYQERTSDNRIDETVCTKTVKLVKEQFSDFKDSHFIKELTQ